MIYIQRKDGETGQLETVDQFEKRSEAKQALRDYRVSDKTSSYYTSSRACKDWKE
jgi:hypothetical protein